MKNEMIWNNEMEGRILSSRKNLLNQACWLYVYLSATKICLFDDSELSDRTHTYLLNFPL